MTILIIALIIAFSVWGYLIVKTGKGQIPFASELEEPADGYTDSVCRKCGGTSFSIRTTGLLSLGAIERSMTEVICQMCGETVFKTYNSYKEKTDEPTLHQ
jgi:ribosomal protein L37E